MPRTHHRLAALGLIIPLALAGCTSTEPQPSISVAPSGTPGEIGADIVRDGAPGLPSVVAVATLTGGNTDDCEFAVFSVTATESSTVLDWGTQCSTSTPHIEITRSENLPSLRLGDDTYKVTRYDDINNPLGNNAYRHLATTIGQFRPEARPSSASYGPLPTGTTSVEITSPLFAAPITVPVTKHNLHAGGTPDLPILARVTLQGVEDRGSTPLLASVHGIRRVPGATAVYYSLTSPDGGDQSGFLTLNSYGNHTIYDPEGMTLGAGGNFVNAFAAFDYDQDVAIGQLGRNGRGDYGDLAPGGKVGHALSKTSRALTAVAYLPVLPATTDKVDLLLGGRFVLQDLPVSDGAMSPTSTEQFPVLGTGWPTVPEQMLTSMPAEESTNVTSALIQVVTDGKITHAGDTLELNTELLFNYNEATLTNNADQVIKQAAADITAAGSSGTITITGHTDNTGSDSYNLDLSKRRAQTVADALRPHLPAAITMTVDGKGETQPTADNTTDAGKAANRRVVVTLPQ